MRYNCCDFSMSAAVHFSALRRSPCTRRWTRTSAPRLQHQSATIRCFSSSDEDEKLNTAKKKPTAAVAYSELAKAKLSALVVSTSAAGFVAAGEPIAGQLDVLAACLIGTALCSSSAAAWNQIFEIDRDRLMKRTQQRPLVTEAAITKSKAQLAATTWAVAGTGILAVGTDPVTTALGVGNVALYAGLYTYMKPRSVYNTWVGAVVGAIPPVMGWTAATGGSLFDMPALMLGSTLYLWQMPHFFALSYMYRTDYARGGFQMIPALESDGEQTSNIIVRYAWYLSAVPFVSALTNVTSTMFAVEGVLLNAYALHVAHKFRRERTNANARKVFLTSLWYLPSLLMLFLLHSKSWDDDKDDDKISQLVAEQIHWIRSQGKELCVHEKHASEEAADHCPVKNGKKATNHSLEQAASAVVRVPHANGTVLAQDRSQDC